MILEVFSNPNHSVILNLQVHALLACQCTELGGVLHHQPDRHLVTVISLAHSLGQSYSQVSLCAGLGLSPALEMLFEELCLPCLRVLEPRTSSTRDSRFLPGVVLDLFPALWGNVDTSWQVANKIYTVQNMPELSK